MGCIGITLSCHVDFRLTGRATPRAVAWNAAGVYENLKWMATPDGGYIYPSGQDWALFRNPQKAHLHVLMAAFENDPDGWSLARNAWDAMDRMQARSEDGRVFLPGEYRFASTQHDTIGMFGLQWLCLHLADPIRDEPVLRLGTRHLESGGLILHRSPKAFVTLSYGAKIMAQIAAMRPDRIVSPDQRSLIGGVYLAGEKKPPAPRIAAVDVNVTDDGFTATLCVEHGPRVRADLAFHCDSAGALHVREHLTAAKDVTVTKIATGMLGVLNNKEWIYEKGHRTLTFDSTSTVVPAHSGKTLTGAPRHVVIDDALAISSPGPLSVRYTASTGPERGRATDRLYLNYVTGNTSYKAGQVIGGYEATLRIR